MLRMMRSGDFGMSLKMIADAKKRKKKLRSEINKLWKKD